MADKDVFGGGNKPRGIGSSILDGDLLDLGDLGSDKKSDMPSANPHTHGLIPPSPKVVGSGQSAPKSSVTERGINRAQPSPSKSITENTSRSLTDLLSGYDFKKLGMVSILSLLLFSGVGAGGYYFLNKEKPIKKQENVLRVELKESDPIKIDWIMDTRRLLHEIKKRNYQILVDIGNIDRSLRNSKGPAESVIRSSFPGQLERFESLIKELNNKIESLNLEIDRLSIIVETSYNSINTAYITLDELVKLHNEVSGIYGYELDVKVHLDHVNLVKADTIKIVLNVGINGILYNIDSSQAFEALNSSINDLLKRLDNYILFIGQNDFFRRLSELSKKLIK